jgi:thioredoxin
MKKLFSFITVLCFSLSSILTAQTTQNIDATSFNSKLKQNPKAQLVDVRTAGEFAKGHIQNAKNMDVSGSDFKQKVGALDKNTAVYLYCLSGARSSNAMRTLSSMGFKELYNLSGGMMSWRAANLPETTANATSTTTTSAGMSKADYNALLKANKLVLIDFYGEWCAPCKKMKPYLEEISKEMKEKVDVVRIDIDANKALIKELKVQDVPVLYLYKAKALVWSHQGFISKEEVVKVLNAN